MGIPLFSPGYGRVGQGLTTGFLGWLFWLGGSCQLTAMQAEPDPSANRSVSLSARERREVLKDLPSIQTFRKKPSTRFLVDPKTVRRGHPYLGTRASRPHTGGHVYFHLPAQGRQSAAGNFFSGDQDVRDYPSIYAVADGVITRVDYSFELKTMFEPALGKKVANKRYGMALTFAREKTTGISFHYSIEPFIRPAESRFYEPFILVKPGQKVKQGDLIARMYLPPSESLARKSHIHFNLLRDGGGGFLSPSIFSKEVVRAFYDRWNLLPSHPDSPIPPCMGYLLGADENPFQRVSVDRL